MIQCGLPTLPNLVYSQQEARPGSTTTVTCNDGYNLKGSNILTCSDDGEFDHALPVCECE